MNSLVSNLRTHRARQLKQMLFAGPKWKESGLVFASTIGTAFEPRNLVRKFHSPPKKAGLVHYRFHNLRHSCATLLMLKGVPARTIMEILGRSQISLTMNTYGHVMLETRREAMELVESALGGRK